MTERKRLFRGQHPRGGAATFFPMSAIVKPNLEDRAYRKAGMPDYRNVETLVETIAAILT